MKTKQYLAMAFAATALFACNNDDAPKPEEMGEAGKAWASFSISIPKSSMTRAADGNATNAEMEIKTVTLYQEGAGNLGGAKEVANFVVSDFTQGTVGDVNTYVANKAVPVKGTAGGTCNIFAVINKGAAIAERHILANPTANSVLTISSVDDLKAASTGFVMSSKIAVEATMYGTGVEALAATPRAVIEVDRAVSKVLVKAAAALDLAGNVADKSATGNFTGSSVKWLIGNSNRKFNVIPNADLGKDPNWSALVAGSTFVNLAAEYFQLTPAGNPAVNPTYTMAVAANTATATTNGVVQYCVENNNQEYQVGNTSYVSIIAEFTPSKIVTDADVAADNAITYPATPGAAQTTFYYHVAKQLYFNAAAYDKYVATATTTSVAAGAAAVKEFFGPYTNGQCYYHVPIGEGIADLQTAALGVARNHFYSLTIKSLTAPGNPLPTTPDPTDPGVDPSEPTDPEIPIVPSSAWIAVDLDVKAWTGVQMGEVDLN